MATSREDLTTLMKKLEWLQISLPNELSEVVALSEERLTQLEALHCKIDAEAETALQNLNVAIMSVNKNRKACHEELEVVLGGQIESIQGLVNRLEARMKFVTELLEIPIAREKSEMESIENYVNMIEEVKKLLERAGDIEARIEINNQPRPIVSTKTALCNYTVPLLTSSKETTALKDAVPVTAVNVDCLDVDIAVLNGLYSSLISDCAGSVRVMDTITGELERRIDINAGQFYGLAVSTLSAPMLFMSCFNLHNISVFDVMTGELVKTIESRGFGVGQFYDPYGLCVRQLRRAKQPTEWLYVCDSKNQRVQIFDTISGKSVLTIGTQVGRVGDKLFNRPLYVTTFEGNSAINAAMIFVSDNANHRVQVHDADTGAYVKTIGRGGGDCRGCEARVA